MSTRPVFQLFLPINVANIMEKFLLIFSNFLKFLFVLLLVHDPLRVCILIVNELVFKICFNIDKHVSSGLGLDHFFRNFHLLGVEINRLVKSTKIIIKYLFP